MKSNVHLKTSHAFILVACHVSAIWTAHLQAQTWQTVLDYQLAPGQFALARGIAADPAGQVLSVGMAYDASTNSHGIALTTDTTQLSNGASAVWNLSDDSLLDNPNINPSQHSSQIWHCGYDSSGNLYSVGQLYPKAGTTSWYVRKSSDNGLSWSDTDPFYQYSPGLWSGAYGFAADALGGIYVVGGGSSQLITGSGKHTTTNYIGHWLVRKSTDGGQSWKLVDDLTNSAGGSTWRAMAATTVPGIGVFVVGQYSALGPWLMRKSVSGNAGTWSTVDGPIDLANALGVGGDSLGNVYVAGHQFIVTGTTGTRREQQTTGYWPWVTRMSSDGGQTWTTVDTFTLVPSAPNQNTPGAYAYGIGTDSVGNPVAVGVASDGTSGHWIVRRRDPATGQWTTIDDFLPAIGGSATAYSAVSDAAGHLLVAGQANWGDGTGVHWIVRQY